MKERPILFSAPMVRAILAGTKTQTRRLIKPQPIENDKIFEWTDGDFYRAPVEDPRIADFRFFQCPYGQPGDRLWVRETWRHYIQENRTVYRADGEDDTYPLLTWRPSIHMPRWASRIDLEITAVRVERVRDIGEADAMAEGVQPDGRAGVDPHKYAFKRLWDELYAKRGYGWASDPWVWAVTFRRVQP